MLKIKAKADPMSVVDVLQKSDVHVLHDVIALMP